MRTLKVSLQIFFSLLFSTLFSMFYGPIMRVFSWRGRRNREHLRKPYGVDGSSMLVGHSRDASVRRLLKTYDDLAQPLTGVRRFTK